MDLHFDPTAADLRSAPVRHLVLHAVLACSFTWLLAIPCNLAWLRRETPGGLAIAAAGLSAFGPLVATLIVRRGLEHGPAWPPVRAPLGWLFGSLLAPCALHIVATSLYVAAGGRAPGWFHPPTTPDALAALIVFPLGEELGLRGYLGPRLAARLGQVRGALVVGTFWAVWHLGYLVTPGGAIDLAAWLLAAATLPLYSLLIAWTTLRAGGGLAVALAFHAGGHLDHLERAPDVPLGLLACHLIVLVCCALPAVRALSSATWPPRAQT